MNLMVPFSPFTLSAETPHIPSSEHEHSAQMYAHQGMSYSFPQTKVCREHPHTAVLYTYTQMKDCRRSQFMDAAYIVAGFPEMEGLELCGVEYYTHVWQILGRD